MLALGRQAPVLRTVLPGNITGWLVTGFDEVREVLVEGWNFRRRSAGLLSRLPGLRLATTIGELEFKEKMTITSLRELPVTWDC
jgi:hypothetical protein